MARAAALSFDAARDRMHAIVASGKRVRGTWVIALPEKNERGMPWQLALLGMWTDVTFNSKCRLRLCFSELSDVEGGGVIVLVGVR